MPRLRDYLNCPARDYLESHRDPLSPFVTPTPGRFCAACPVLRRCIAGIEYASTNRAPAPRKASMTSFNLANQPWIPVRFHGESQPRNVSIREALGSRSRHRRTDGPVPAGDHRPPSTAAGNLSPGLGA